jgi:hypothetical protein
MDAAQRELNDQIDLATQRLLDDARTIPESELRVPSLLPGWTRAHVLSHVARGADAMRNLLTRRLVEVELHHCDLGIGYGPADWPAAFAAMDLAEPMRSQRRDRLGYPRPSPGAEPRFPARPRRHGSLVSGCREAGSEHGDDARAPRRSPAARRPAGHIRQGRARRGRGWQGSTT